MTETLIEKQIKREDGQVTNGQARYHKHRESTALTDSKVGKKLADRTLHIMIEALEKMVEEVEGDVRRAGRGHQAVYAHYIPHFEAEPVAFITARATLNAAFLNKTLTVGAMVLANLIEETVMFEQLRDDEPDLANSMAYKAKKWNVPSRRRTMMRKAAEVGGVTGLEWTEGDKIRLGTKLIEVFIESCGLVEVRTVREGKKNTTKRLYPTPAASEWLKNQDEKCALLEPRFTPMLVPPVKWTTPISGGYLTRENRVKVISRMSEGLIDEMMSMDMTKVYSALNAVQETPWRINRPVYDLLTQLVTEGSTLGGLPHQDDEPTIARPYSDEEVPHLLKLEDMAPEVQTVMREWTISNAKIYESNVRLMSQRAHVASIISMASDLKGGEEFYFPHNFDFRGRLYSVVPSLNPQSDDIGKGLLELAEGRPLGENGAYWLAVHIANLFGNDKVSFDERAAWTEDNTDAIFDSASDPLDGQRFWCEADDPWCALAACIEWKQACEQGVGFVSHLPIAMDGSCSGIQHFSAMLKDKEGGAAVNLLPVDQPRDIYSDVMDKTKLLLIAEGDPLGMVWVDFLTRKIVKRPCMTFAYSVTSRGMRDQILDEMRKTSPDQMLPGTDNYRAATFLAPYVEQAIRSTVDRAAEAMDWLKGAVRPTLEAQLPVTWVVPDGLPVAHRYVKSTGKRFNVWFQGIRTKVQLRVEGTKHDLRKQQSSIAPNYVHSMDACHLRMVVNRMHDEGITTSFAMIHDSFGVHACDIDELHFAIRDEFIKLYTDSQLEVFRQRMLTIVPDSEVDPVPESGELNLEDIRDAEFFFS